MFGSLLFKFLNFYIDLLDGGGDGVGDGVAVAEPVGIHQLGGGTGGGDESGQNNLDTRLCLLNRKKIMHKTFLSSHVLFTCTIC